MEIIENRAAWQSEFEDDWLKHYQETGTLDWEHHRIVRNKTAPLGKAVALEQSRLMLISSAGGYLKAEQEPFDAANDLGDYTVRAFPATINPDELAFAHEHYDQSAVHEDQQVLLPLAHLQERVAAGAIGELAPSVVNFMGYQPLATRVVDETIPAILEIVKHEQINAALLVPA